MEDMPGPLARERDELSLVCHRLKARLGLEMAISAELLLALEGLYSANPGLERANSLAAAREAIAKAKRG